MFHRWCTGFFLGLGLLAAPPAQPRNQAWVLALDGRGGVVQDLKAEEFLVKVAGKPQPVTQVKTPAQTADAPQSWVLVFEPIRDTAMRAIAFQAAADFLTKVPDGDRVFIVARGKDSLESLMPGFSLRRQLWADALAKVPDMLPEGLVGRPKETLQGAGFQAGYTDASDGAPGQEALNALLTRFRGAATGWAKGTTDRRGVNVLDRLNFDSPSFVTGMLAIVAFESKALESILDQVAAVPGQKHLIVFSRCEADDFSHPIVKQAMTRPDYRPGDTNGQGFRRQKGDAGGPAESAALATRDMTLLQASLKAKAAVSGVTLFSVAGTGQNALGHIGAIAGATGGFGFPLASGLELQFGHGIQTFGSRYCVQWSEDKAPAGPSPLEISTTRKGVKLLLQTLR
jgi:hypothetical protein